MSKSREVVAVVDESVDFDEVATVAREAFGAEFVPAQLQWLYEQSFAHGHTMVSLRADGRKVGQFVMLHQKIRSHGVLENAVQLVDLFVLKRFRSKDALTLLYGEVETQCRHREIRFAIGMPNASAISANQYFFGLTPFCKLDIRVGLSTTWPRRALLLSEIVRPEDHQNYTKALEPYESAPTDDGIPWTVKTLLTRLASPVHQYALHASDEILLVSSPRKRGGVPYTLLCGFFPRTGLLPSPRHIGDVVRAACAMWRCPLHVFVGHHPKIGENAGVIIPDMMRPSTMLVQLRDFHPNKQPLSLECYQPLDFDFA